MMRVLLGQFLLLAAVHVEAYEIETHKDMVSTAARHSNAEQHLQEDLGFVDRLGTSAGGRSLEDWLSAGAAGEDNVPRFLNHFHNPLPSNCFEAGLGGSVGQSVTLWAQNPSQSAPS